MELRYIRKLMTSHMVIPQIERLSEWEEKMITQAALSGVLFGKCICEDGSSDLWYDITGKQSLDVILEGRSLDYDMLCRILMGIYEIAEGLEDVLLRAEDILLLPECIFLNYGMERIYLCYYPHNTVKIEEEFLQLMEFLLIKLAHDDERAVKLAYGIYEQAVKKEWSLYDLKKNILLTYQSEEAFGEPMGDGRIGEMQMEEVYSEQAHILKANVNSGAEKREIESAGIQEKEHVTEKTKGTKAVLKKYMDWIKKCVHIHLPADIKLRTSISKKLHKGSRTEMEERFVFNPEEEEKEHIPRPTVLVTELSHPIEGVLSYEGRGNCENLIISGEEYLIGNEEGCAGYIPSNTVSRRHAKISRIGDVYMIEDLNSLNGTYVGGELLNYKTKVSLHKNEVVIFADEKFRFI